jgi:hypothetical protein
MDTNKSAEGVTGHLINIAGTEKYVFRVYKNNHSFTDYELFHSDLEIKIVDKDAHLYHYENLEGLGELNSLDHAPSTLGK